LVHFQSFPPATPLFFGQACYTKARTHKKNSPNGYDLQLYGDQVIYINQLTHLFYKKKGWNDIFLREHDESQFLLENISQVAHTLKPS